MEKLDFLKEVYITQANRLLRLPPTALDALYESAVIVRGHEGLLELLRQCKLDALSETDINTFAAAVEGYPKFVADQETYLKSTMGDLAGMFSVILLLGLLDWMSAYYRSQGIAENVQIDTLDDLLIWMKHHYEEKGVWGLSNLTWMLNHMGGKLFRLGRLQFIQKAFDQAVIGLRNVNNGQVVLLSEQGIAYRSDGRVDGTNGQWDAEQGWTAIYEQKTDSYIGNPILPSGFAANSIVKLSAEEWRIVIQRGDSALEIHIPEGSPMTPQSCSESLARAISFYHDRMPEQLIASFVCVSWLLDPQLGQLVPESSNISAFQKMLHLFPVRSDDCETYERVFGTDKLDLSTAKKDSGLRRAIIQHVESGHRLHGGGGLLLTGELSSIH
ncbi:acyltransferase domain-containing protein [Paenibacillus sp. 2TAB23]|uniref:acyltransferase domain-containing protein n=1 Tax=Paenibacillus sp. 2TAB23 TaxID=3233004 RepID=UPI003F96B679